MRAFITNISLLRKMNGAFSLALFLQILIGAAAYHSIKVSRHEQASVSQTHQVLEKLQRTLSHIQDAETGQRGYLLTGDQAYLDPYRAAIQTVNNDLTGLRKIVAESPTQLRNITGLDSLATMKLVELDQTIRLRQQQGLNAALEIVRTDQGKKIMDEIRVQIQFMRDEEERILKERIQSSSASKLRVNIILIAGGIISLVAILLTMWIINIDMAALKEAEQKLAAKRMKLIAASKYSLLGEMAAGIAHEINNPLAILLGRSEQLLDMSKEGALDPHAVAKIGTSIQNTAKRVATIVRGLRDFSRDAENDPFEPVALQDLIEDALSLVREKLKREGVALRSSGSSGNVVIECRKTQIAQAILNMVTNAGDAVASLPERWIGVHVNEFDSVIEICITDSGHGIPDDIKEKIFQPFFTTKAVGKGTGLGLSITRGLIESHHGSVRLDLKCPNTRFIISLPKYQRQSNAPQQKDAA